MPTGAVAAQGPPTALPEAVIEGKGYGHGVGMPQDGAYTMAAAGASTSTILATFYPGTSVARRGGQVAVTLLDHPVPDTVLTFPSGGDVRDAQSGAQSPGFPVTVRPGGGVRVAFDGHRYHAFPLAGAAAAPLPPPPPAPPPPAPSPPASSPPTSSPPAAPPPSEPISGRPLLAVPAGGSTVGVGTLGRGYRGTVVAQAGAGGLQLTDRLDVEQYLLGIAEVPPGWPAAALRAQAIAARTYALRAMASGGGICSTDQCQVYTGQAAEHPSTSKAVTDTRGQVLTYGGALADTVYSANGGGVSATPEEGFGEGLSYPYLRAAPYPTTDPQPWTVRLPLADLASRLGYGGHAADVRVSRTGPSGRALEVTFSGDHGPMAVDGRGFASALRLRSTLFTVKVEGGRPAPGAAAAAGAAGTPGGGGGSPSRTALVLARGHESQGLGRAPWIALGLLTLMTAATGAVRVVGTGRRPLTSRG